ncbi:MAG: HEPN domain-containing protein [Planctomycetota bacterium]
MDRQSEHARQWIEKARSDLLNADNNLAANEVPYDTVCFHCQQAAEKLLKGFLVARGCEYPLTHNLFVVLEKVLEFELRPILCVSPSHCLIRTPLKFAIRAMPGCPRLRMPRKQGRPHR